MRNAINSPLEGGFHTVSYVHFFLPADASGMEKLSVVVADFIKRSDY